MAVDLFNIQEVSLSLTYLTQIKHAYTHFQVVVDAFFCYLSTDLSLEVLDFKNWTSGQWKTIEELDQLALTGITNKLIPILKNPPILLPEQRLENKHQTRFFQFNPISSNFADYLGMDYFTNLLVWLYPSERFGSIHC